MCVMPSRSHLQRKFGCSDTALASCLHPQLELSNMLDSLFRTCSLRAPTLILRSSIFKQTLRSTRTNGNIKVKLYVLKHVLNSDDDVVESPTCSPTQLLLMMHHTLTTGCKHSSACKLTTHTHSRRC